jgi:hypothetical protein
LLSVRDFDFAASSLPTGSRTNGPANLTVMRYRRQIALADDAADRPFATDQDGLDIPAVLVGSPCRKPGWGRRGSARFSTPSPGL